MTKAATPPWRDREGRFDAHRLLVGVLALVLSGAILCGAAALAAMHRSAADRGFVFEGQAAQFARSGLVAATNWMCRQPAQPVVAIDPTMLDSSDPAIGFVRECWIADRTWGRFEVGRIPAQGVRDLSAERGLASRGQVWQLRSVGYVFERNPDDQPFDQARILDRVDVEVEVARLGVRLPARVALAATELEVDRVTRILGGRKELKHAPTVAAVFGVDWSALRAMADHHVTRASLLPKLTKTGSLLVAELESLEFTGGRPLCGHGIVVVRGNVAVNPGSVCDFCGVLFVDGDLEVRGEGAIHGAVLATGKVTIRRSRDAITIRYDEELLRSLAGMLGCYRNATPVRFFSRKH